MNKLIPPVMLLCLGISAGGYNEVESDDTKASKDTIQKEGRPMSTVSIRYMIDDVPTAITFYTTQLGFALDHDASPAFASVTRNGVRLLLSGKTSSGRREMPDGRQPVPGGWNRIHIQVDDLEAEVKRLREAGLKFRNDIITGPGGSQILLDDPSGNPVELFQPKTGADDPDKERAHDKFEAVKRSPEHAKLKEMEGTWKATVKPTSGPKSKGTMSMKMDLGDLWLVWDFKSEKGDFSGRRLDTYDPQSKKFYAVWVDSMSTTPLQMSGNYEGNQMVMVGESRGADGEIQRMKFVTEMKDKNNIDFTIYAPGPDGKESAIMSIMYERAK